VAGSKHPKTYTRNSVLRNGVNREHSGSFDLHPLRWRILRAQNLVEFALIFPVLVFLMIGVFDLGRAFYALIQISNAAREGVRYGVTIGLKDTTVPPDGIYEINDAGIKNAVKGEIGNFLDADKLVIPPPVCVCREPDPDPDPLNDLCPSPAPSSDCVSEGTLRVFVEYSYTTIFFPSGDFTLVRDMEMMIP